MRKRIACFALSVMFLALSFASEAQQPVKVPRIGLLTTASTVVAATWVDAFRQVCASWAISREKTSFSKSAGARQNPIDFAIWWLSWSV